MFFFWFLKSANGKDYVNHLLSSVEARMPKLNMDTDDRQVQQEVRLTVVETRVDLVRRDLGRSDQRINVVVARAAEEADAIQNERFI